MAKRRFRIDAGPYGGELALGQVDKEFVDYFIDKDESDLIEHVNPTNGMVLKIKQFQIKEDFYAWYECDDIEHLNNAYS